MRLSDFKSNEYSSLTGGARYKPHEENLVLGFRGASRYIVASFRDCFELECRALKKVRDDLEFINIEIMVPFVRTMPEVRNALETARRAVARAFRRLLDWFEGHNADDARA